MDFAKAVLTKIKETEYKEIQGTVKEAWEKACKEFEEMKKLSQEELIEKAIKNCSIISLRTSTIYGATTMNYKSKLSKSEKKALRKQNRKYS